MRKAIPATIILAALSALAYIAIDDSSPKPPTISSQSSTNSQDTIQQQVDLLDRYQIALSQANRVIEEMNADIATAQAIDVLDELETHIDTIPMRDTIAHPQP